MGLKRKAEKEEERNKWRMHEDCPGGPVVKTPRVQCKGVQVRSLVEELRSCMLRSVAKKKKLLNWFSDISFKNL